MAILSTAGRFNILLRTNWISYVGASLTTLSFMLMVSLFLAQILVLVSLDLHVVHVGSELGGVGGSGQRRHRRIGSRRGVGGQGGDRRVGRPGRRLLGLDRLRLTQRVLGILGVVVVVQDAGEIAARADKDI